ncbi:NAD(P)-dependent oxidoreductase [Phenylobacterium sp.]|uniref:NAD-dependent epimerase/dehydratase family protein n=1 Tax=Phenylobacterium sp. TaxID=1871053 RepID=UPI002731D8BB|nr:NAD(P)-dependent oxidoreductase [Phenylobacterium sp.]MDP1600739.1 NAD(P)-dependent oxidoreductase [Phenylobacterium sp.]MDP3590375.1 NAD(P)-dependent oxidoreductase [Phenylobacterium sp.]
MAKILLTGASSFSGLWIAEALAAAGYQVTAPVRRPWAYYSGLRAERIERLATSVEVVFEAPFASSVFSELAGDGFDLLAHHAADIPNYRSADYDVMDGVSRNLLGAEVVFSAFAKAGGKAVIATGTAFEAGEGQAEPGDLAVSPYGLSKTLTNEAIRHFARWRGLKFGKFVIAGPFGPLEEGRFGWSLFQRWFADEAGLVRTPRYIRDNIPVPLLGKAYVLLAGDLLNAAGPDQKIARPSGFVGTQEAFAHLLAREMSPRLGLACRIEAAPQPELIEPLVRVNSDPWITTDWPAVRFWDDYAAYYQRVASSGMLSGPA